MVTDRYKVGSLIIKDNGGYKLKITIPESDEAPKLEINSLSQKWAPLDNLEKEDQIYNIKNRKGIWFEKDKIEFYSKVSLFEETEYYLELIPPGNLKRGNTPQAENSSEEIEFNPKNGYINTKGQVNKGLGKTVLFNRFFESKVKWTSDLNKSSRGDEKYKLIMRELIKDKKWSINFKAYTGRLKIKKDIIGNDFNDIEVIPKKLTKENYFQILNGLNTFISQIFFMNKSPTEVSATKDYISTEIKNVELYDCAKYLLLNSIMKELSRYFYGLMKNLNTKFYYFNEQIKVYELKNASNINYVQTLSNPSNLFLLENEGPNKLACFSLNGDYFTFNELIINSKYLSYNTPENRFIKFILKLLYNELDREQIRRLFKEIEKYNNLPVLNDYLADLSEKIYLLERKEIKNLQIIPYNSQILQKNSYYRRFLQYFIWLQNFTVFNIDELFFIDIKPMWLLYEYYCLYTMKKSLDLLTKSEDGLLDFPDNMENHILYPPDGNISEYRATKFIQIEYKNKKGEIIRLIYKPKKLNLKNAKNEEILESYSTKTGQDPDFILVKIKDGKVCSYNGKKNHMVVIDSKYRVESGNLWAKMHFYKDALNAIGTIFINPSVDEKSFENSGKLLTPYGEITEDKIVNKTIIEYGFVTGVNVLGLIESSDPASGFKKLFKIILEKYFQ